MDISRKTDYALRMLSMLVKDEGSLLSNYGSVTDEDENLYHYVLSQVKMLELEPEGLSS